MSHLVLVAALWGWLASWVNEFIKQDRWPKGVNTVIADAVLVITAAVVAWQGTNTFTLHAFWICLLGAALAALGNLKLFLEPTGVGPHLQSATSLPPKA